MKTAISIPDDVFRTAERFAREQHVTRSAFFTRAIQEFMNLHRREGITERLNKVYSRNESALDPALDSMQMLTVSKEKW